MKLPDKLKEKKKQLISNNVVSISSNEIIDESYIEIPEKEDKFNKRIEKIIRTSPEYKRWIGIMTNELDLTRSAFIPEVDIEDSHKLKIEMNHYPFGLYDIVSFYRDKLKDDGNTYQSYNPFYVAQEVMKLHYQGYVSVVPMDKTTHELYHSGNLFIPLTSDYVFGDYHKITDDEKILPTEDFMANLKVIEDETEKIKRGESELNTHILDRSNPIKIEMEDVNHIKFIED